MGEWVGQSVIHGFRLEIAIASPSLFVGAHLVRILERCVHFSIRCVLKYVATLQTNICPPFKKKDLSTFQKRFVHLPNRGAAWPTNDLWIRKRFVHLLLLTGEGGCKSKTGESDLASTNVNFCLKQDFYHLTPLNLYFHLTALNLYFSNSDSPPLNG